MDPTAKWTSPWCVELFRFFSRLPGSDAPFPNGIEMSDDERYAYFNTFNGARKIDIAT